MVIIPRNPLDSERDRTFHHREPNANGPDLAGHLDRAAPLGWPHRAISDPRFPWVAMYLMSFAIGTNRAGSLFIDAFINGQRCRWQRRT